MILHSMHTNILYTYLLGITMYIHFQVISIIIRTTRASVDSLAKSETQIHRVKEGHEGCRVLFFLKGNPEVLRCCCKARETIGPCLGFLFLSAGYNVCYMGSHTVNS